MSAPAPEFPRPLESYQEVTGASLPATLWQRAESEPFNAIATGFFLLAIIHSFLAAKFTRLAHRWRAEHAARRAAPPGEAGPRETVSFRAECLHFLGEVEVVFGLWAIPLLLAVTLAKGWPVAEEYMSHTVHFTEPLFVVVIMCIAATRPVLGFAEAGLGGLARLAGGSRAAWWCSILTVGPLLGSLITEPAAMTICALLLGRHFYGYAPRPAFAYATLGLLFVNVSIGGTLTHFAAPPVLMVAGRWGWGTPYMMAHFGWKAVAAILCANLLYGAIFWRQWAGLRAPSTTGEVPSVPVVRDAAIPFWITAVHLLFLAWTVFTAHHPALFIGGFLIFLGFTSATEHHQHPLELKPAILVGFFLAGLVIHGGLQGWWIAPVLARLSEVPLFLSAVGLTAVNDNAAITYLASQVPNLAAPLQYVVTAGAVVGGGLTVIANAPNPAGQSLLHRYFEDGVSPARLFLGALLPTSVAALFFILFR